MPLTRWRVSSDRACRMASLHLRAHSHRSRLAALSDSERGAANVSNLTHITVRSGEVATVVGALIPVIAGLCSATDNPQLRDSDPACASRVSTPP
jgi:hypothetical protein